MLEVPAPTRAPAVATGALEPAVRERAAALLLDHLAVTERGAAAPASTHPAAEGAADVSTLFTPFRSDIDGDA